MLKRTLLVILIVALNLFLLETGARLLVIQAKPTLGKTPTFDRKFQIANTKQDRTPDVLLLGDSLMYFGIYPELLDVLFSSRKNGFNSLNLATPSASVEMNLFLMKRLVHQSGLPKLVIYNFSPRVFNGSHEVDEYDEAFKTSYYQRCFEPANPSINNNLRCFLERNFALARYRDFLNGEMEKMPRTWFQFHQRMAFSEDDNPEFEISGKGWAPAYNVHTPKSLHAKFGDNEKVEDVFQKELGNFQWTTEKILPLLAYCRKMEVPVLIIWLPEQKLMDRYYRQIGLSQKMLASRLRQLSDEKHVYFLDLSDMPIQQSGFSDLDHLNPLGSVKTTEKLAGVLAGNPYYSLLTQTGGTP